MLLNYGSHMKKHVNLFLKQ